MHVVGQASGRGKRKFFEIIEAKKQDRKKKMSAFFLT
jgi:hypothetical protein